MLALKLHWQILIALVLAVIAGRLSGTDAEIFGIRFLAIYSFLGTLFMNALKMLIVPLIMSSIITGIAGIGGGGAMGRLGSKTLLYYLTTTLLAVLTGLIMVNIMSPGLVDGEPAREIVSFLEDADTTDIAARVQGRGAEDVVEIFIRMVPVNIVAAAAEGKMLGLIFFSLLFGYFMTRIEGPPARTLK
ncbi:MAG TPA: dicarboxylate/amino acid:cation symporter, partial [Gammaproteobacteria bacterium]|nr:dicarboxylate/amino acid:cation symporter [Gammaproteobacteria bacterium]